MDFQHAREVFEHALLWGALGGAVLLALVCLFHYAARSFADTLRRAGLTKRGMGYAFWAFCLVVFVSYAGTKPSNALRSARSTETEEDGPFPSVRSSLTDEDYTAGFALSRIGTNETWNFEAPDDAVPKEEWRVLGAANVWFRHAFEDDWTFPIGTNTIGALTVFPHGTLRPRTKDTATHISPLNTPMGLAWASRWEELDESARPSQFWHLYTPSNTLVMTWQNALLDEDAAKPLSLQVEFLANGDLDFRYDLSRLPGEAISNLTVGVMNAGVGRSFTAISNNTTSLRWARLDSTLADDPDPDGDGLTTEEEVLLYHTDPYAKDSDYDGLDDKYEVEIEGLDPLNAHSLDERYCDSVAQIIGDVDPWSYPEGSTNTVWEHVFYTGTTNQPFAYPVATDDTAILEITVSGSGSGELIIGDRIIPLLAQLDTERIYLVDFDCGVKNSFNLNVAETLDLEMDSDSLFIGDMMWPLKTWGWFAFPHTTATIPCIHNLNGNGKTVALTYGEEFSGLTATWESDASDVVITNNPPVSAKLYGTFDKTQTRTISYCVAHPNILNKKKTSFAFTQMFRYCPQLAAEDDKPDETDEDEDEDENNYWADTIPESDAEEAAAYTNNLTQSDVSDASNILRLYRSNTNTVSLVVLDGEPSHCCSCPEHWSTNYAAVAWHSSKLEVIDGDGNEFSSTTTSCDVHVIGVKPSLVPNDALVAFVTNGVIDRISCYTVLGLCFKPASYEMDSMDRYNELSKSFGYPLVVNTNLEWATGITIVSDVRLTNGIVRVALEGVSSESSNDGEFEVYLPEWTGSDGQAHSAELLLKTDGREERFFTHAQWRAIIRRYNQERKLPLKILSPKAGPVDLVVEYENVENKVRISDYARQRITSIPPPVLPDYNHDGVIDDFDASEYLWARPYQFWVNEDTIKGDYIGQESDSAINSTDLVVNGKFDLMNLFAVRIDTSLLRSRWANANLSYAIGSAKPVSISLNVTFVDLSPDAVCSIQTNAICTLSGDLLSEAELQRIRSDYITLGQTELDATNLMLVAEAPYSESRALALRVFDGTKELFRAPLRVTSSSVRRMYRWLNVRPYSNDSSGRTTKIDKPVNLPYDSEGATNFIFLHGASVSSDEAEVWGDQIFKRLWHAGCHVDFYNVDWSGDLVAAIYYQENVSNAFVVASQLAPILSTNIIGSKVVMAHSLGNMVVSSMIHDYGLEVSKYLMCDSAVPAEAYDDSLTLRSPYLVHPYWVSYPTNTWAAEYHKLFENDSNDDRRLLGWPGRFSGVEANAINFYSTGDEVLELYNGDNLTIFTGITNSFSHYAWHKQELFKGRAKVISGFGCTKWSGWSFDTTLVGTARISATEAAGMTDEELKTNTVFELNPESMATNEIPLLVRAAHLAQGIPALTQATGYSSFSRAFMDDQTNFDLDLKEEALGVLRPNDWPTRDDYEGRWLHSDIKDVAYYFNFMFYKLVKEKGSIQ